MESSIKLTQPVSREEVLSALSSMHPYKAPRPDDFEGIFFKQFWHTIGDNVCSLISQAFQSGYFNPSLTETLIAIIPKVDCPKSDKDFCPTSLCNTIYKLISKVLVNKIRPFLKKLMDLSRVASYLVEG